MTTQDKAVRPRPKKSLSDARYVRFKGQRCPYCRSPEIEAPGGVEIDGGNATQEIRCNNCERDWTDLYYLVGYLPSPD